MITPATCTEKGKSKFICICGDSYEQETSIKEHKIVAATYEQGEHCSVCGEVFGKALEKPESVASKVNPKWKSGEWIEKGPGDKTNRLIIDLENNTFTFVTRVKTNMGNDVMIDPYSFTSSMTVVDQNHIKVYNPILDKDWVFTFTGASDNSITISYATFLPKEEYEAWRSRMSAKQ